MGIFWHFEIGENYDKNTIHLPRQCLMYAVKALILLDFLGITE